MDDYLRKTLAMASELIKALTILPHSWNKRFHVFLRPLQGLVAKLNELS
jgi:hypothetical protein